MTAFFALIISTPPHSYGQLNHTLRVITMLAATAVAMWISHLRGQRNAQLWTARSETRNERRRRVAAETAQRMQTMARALTTAADPAQVADAVFAAMRDELRVDAATFAILDERGVLHTLRRFGYEPDDPSDGVLDSLQIDGPILGHSVAFFAETVDDLRRERPDIYESLDSKRFGRRLGPSRSSRWSSPTALSAPSSSTGRRSAGFPRPTGRSSSRSQVPPRRRSSAPD